MSLSRILTGVLIGTTVMILALVLTAAINGALVLALGWLLMGALFGIGSAGLFAPLLRYANSPVPVLRVRNN